MSNPKPATAPDLSPTLAIAEETRRIQYLQLLAQGPVSRFAKRITGAQFAAGGAYRELYRNSLARPVAVQVFAQFSDGVLVSISRHASVEQEVERLGNVAPYSILSSAIILAPQAAIYVADAKTAQAVTANDVFTVRLCDPIGDNLLGPDAWPNRK